MGLVEDIEIDQEADPDKQGNNGAGEIKYSFLLFSTNSAGITPLMKVRFLLYFPVALWHKSFPVVYSIRLSSTAAGKESIHSFVIATTNLIENVSEKMFDGRSKVYK